MCVCVSLQSHNCSRSRFLLLSRKLLPCVRMSVCACVYTDVFIRVRARVGLIQKRSTEKRDFSNCNCWFFQRQRPFTVSGSLMVYTLIPGHKLLFQFWHKNHRAENSSSKTSHQHHHRPQFEKSLEDARNVSPRDVITRRATTTSSGARRCC